MNNAEYTNKDFNQCSDRLRKKEVQCSRNSHRWKQKKAAHSRFANIHTECIQQEIVLPSMKIAIYDASTTWTGTTNYILIESSMSTCAKSTKNSALHRNRTILISTRPGWVHIPEVGAGSSYWDMLDRISSTRTTASKFFSFLVLFYLAAKPEILDPIQFLEICCKTWKKKQKNQ